MFTFSSLQNQALVHAVSGKSDGNIDARFSSADTVTANLGKISTQLNLDPKTIVQAEQVHATNIALVDSSHQGQIIKNTDALITKDPNTTLMLRIADCAPIILFDPANHALGLVHSGWRGAIGKIGPLALEQMLCQFGTKPEEVLIAIGPCLSTLTLDRPPLQQDLPEWHDFIDTKDNTYTVNLLGFIVHSFEAVGVPGSGIQSSGINTQASTDYFSHIRSQIQGDPEGRFTALAKLA